MVWEELLKASALIFLFYAILLRLDPFWEVLRGAKGLVVAISGFVSFGISALSKDQPDNVNIDLA